MKAIQLSRSWEQMQRPAPRRSPALRNALRLVWMGVVTVMLLVQPFPAQAGEDEVVHAVFFYSPNCSHCHMVVTEDLPPLLEKYGQQFSILAVDTTHPDGQTLYRAAIRRFKISRERQGVPTIIVGESVLVGTVEISQQLRPLVGVYLAQGGSGLPDIPGLTEALSGAQTMAGPETRVPGADEAGGAAGVYARFRQDVAGNTLSLLVLLAIASALLVTMNRFRKVSGGPGRHAGQARLPQWTTLGLILVGLTVSAYMAYVEMTQIPAVCGPVGNCNAVQQSAYARLFGVVPIGVIGVVGYAVLVPTWIVGRRCRSRHGRWARLALPAMALLGTLFSAYLSFLEPFVIGATCIWCLTSALAITGILLLTADGGQRALAELAGS